jgi:hypothetical protein
MTELSLILADPKNILDAAKKPQASLCLAFTAG